MLIDSIAFQLSVQRVAVISLHTSPLAQPGTGDSGGMNVYVRELVSALAQAGVPCDVYTRRWADDLPDEVQVAPGPAGRPVCGAPPRRGRRPAGRGRGRAGLPRRPRRGRPRR